MQDHAEEPRAPVQAGRGEVDETPIGDASRWLAAVSYAFLVCLLVLYEVKQHRRRDDFVRFHARQSFVLCFTEVVLLVIYWILEATIGKGIPYLGAFITAAYGLVFGLGAVAVSVWGFVEALSGARWELPILGQYADRVPLD